MLRSLIRVSFRTAHRTLQPQIKSFTHTGPSGSSTRLFSSTYISKMSSDPKTETPAAESKPVAPAPKAENKPAAAAEGEDGEGEGKISKSAGGLSLPVSRLLL
jgi:hypothetical protein